MEDAKALLRQELAQAMTDARNQAIDDACKVIYLYAERLELDKAERAILAGAQKCVERLKT